MPLTDGAKKVLEFIHSSTQPFDQLTIDEAREGLRNLSSRFSQLSEPVGKIEDIEVPRDGGSVRVRVYRPAPESRGEPLPIVIMLHGGGWALGDFETHDWFSRALCNESQAVIVAVDYRRTPEHPYPAPLNDVMTVISWAAEHKSSLATEKAPLFVLGDSAGGNLAAAAATLARDAGPHLSGQVLIYPVLDARLQTPSCNEFHEGFFLTVEKLQWYWEMYVSDPGTRKLPLVSPLQNEDLMGLPPTLVITAECDPLRDEGELYVESLNDAGVEAIAHRFEGMIHAFTLMPDAIPEARQAVVLCADFIRAKS